MTTRVSVQSAPESGLEHRSLGGGGLREGLVVSSAPSRQTLVVLGLALLLILTFVAALVVGSTPVSLGVVIDILLGRSSQPDAVVIVVETIRLPRALTALLAGAALGIAGLQMQTLFRNPLADPFALGISAGATLGVALVMLGSGYSAGVAFGATTGLQGDALIVVAAVTGSSLVLGLVLLVSARITNPTTVLVLGLMFGYAVSAVVTVLVGVSQPERLQQWAQWGFGSFSGVTWTRFGALCATDWPRPPHRWRHDEATQCPPPR